MKLSELALKAVNNCRNLDPEIWAPLWLYYHYPGILEGKPCRVCLAGGHLAGEYGTDPTKNLCDQELYTQNDNLQKETQILERIRRGCWSGANEVLTGKPLPKNIRNMKDVHRNGQFETWPEFNAHLDEVERNALRFQNEGY